MRYESAADPRQVGLTVDYLARARAHLQASKSLLGGEDAFSEKQFSLILKPVCRFASIATAACVRPKRSDPRNDYMRPADAERVDAMMPDAEILDGGIRFRVDEEGTGPFIKTGDRVNTIYTGTLIDGTVQP